MVGAICRYTGRQNKKSLKIIVTVTIQYVWKLVKWGKSSGCLYSENVLVVLFVLLVLRNKLFSCPFLDVYKDQWIRQILYIL